MRDEFSIEVKRIVAARVGTQCSNPGCGANTSGPQDDPVKALNVGVAAHITAAAPGGPRYREVLTEEQRASVGNAIWLCQNCAKLIDNDVSQFNEELLRAWKVVAEHKARYLIGKTTFPINETESQRKARTILEWKGKRVMLVQMNTGHAVHAIGLRASSCHVHLIDCTEFYVQVRGDSWTGSRSIPLNNVEIGWDDKLECLELQERNI